MAKELPYFRFTVAEWLQDDVSLESYEVKGVFADVCAYYWFKDCSVALVMLEKRFSDAEDAIKLLIKLDIIKVDPNDFIYINFLDEQYDLLSKKHKNLAKAGRAGGLKKSSNAKATLKQRSSYKDKDKDKEKDNNKDNNTLMSDLSGADNLDDYENIAFSFWTLCKSNMDELGINSTDIGNAKYKNWVNPIRLAIEKDGRTTEEFREIFEFLREEKPNEKGFSWKANIRSGASLREKFEKILMRVRSSEDGDMKEFKKQLLDNMK